MDIGYKTHVGNVRKKNQDSYLIWDNSNMNVHVFAVADGLGGHNAGEIASKTVVDLLKNSLNNMDSFNQNNMINTFNTIIEEINSQVFKMSIETSELSGMGTTLSLCILIDNRLTIFHIGDSRIYLIDNENIKQLTKDHSLVEELIKNGNITREEASNHPQKNIITRAIGTEKNIKIDFYDYQIKKNNVILLCSDGLTNMVSNSKIKDIIVNNNCQEAAELLISHANNSGGLDNITVVLFRVGVVL